MSAGADSALARLRRGDVLRMELLDGCRRRFWFDAPIEEVSEAEAHRLLADRSLIEAGDSLFGLAGNSQTWLPAEEDDAE